MKFTNWKNPIERGRKISQSLTGKKLSPEHRKKLSDAKKGKKRFPCPDEVKLKISNSEKGKIGLKKENNPNWKGGISFEPYSVDWTKTLKRSIRERDKYICQVCKSPQEDRALDVHHIDYKKENCNPINLISLCVKCHRKTGFNRDYWINYFKNNEKSE